MKSYSEEEVIVKIKEIIHLNIRQIEELTNTIDKIIAGSTHTSAGVLVVDANILRMKIRSIRQQILAELRKIQ